MSHDRIFRTLAIALFLFLSAGPTSASARKSAAPAAPPQIVASFSVLGDMARQIGGEYIEVHVLAGPDIDAQSYAPAHNDTKTVSRADLVIANGLGYDAWMDKLVKESGTEAPIIVASRGVKPRTTEDGATSPYAWMAPANGKMYASNIAEALEELAHKNAAPEQAQAIRLRATRYLEEIDDAHSNFHKALVDIPVSKRFIITGRDAYTYLAASCDLTAMPYAAPEAQTTIKTQGIRHIFLDSASEPRPVMLLAANTGARLGGTLYAVLSPPDGPAPTYLALLGYNASKITKAMAENGR
ncbi:MAG: zinc ABC transporter substrate-binding protein [Bdellovibrionales bacterium]